MNNVEVEYTETMDGKDYPVPGLGSSFLVAYDASVASTNALSEYTDQPYAAVRITPTTDCFVVSAAAPTALAEGTCHYLPMGIPQDLRFPSTHKLAFIKKDSAGSAYVTVLR